MRFSRVLSSIALLGAVGVHPVGAQPGPSRARADSTAAADSVAVLETARGAQGDFERIRRANLPRRQGISGRYCDEVIGRYCFTDDGDTSEYALPETPPTEASRITSARETLIARLDSAGDALPGDEWIVGHRVRYRIEAGHLGDAERVARNCAAARWWCDALLGMVHHAGWRYPEADSAFAAALAAMPEDERCIWMDLSAVLADSVAKEYRRTPCAERASLNDRIWWLADPSHLRQGNDRRTEHYVRVTLDRLQRSATSGYGTR